jgi:hypothetical protein
MPWTCVRMLTKGFETKEGMESVPSLEHVVDIINKIVLEEQVERRQVDHDRPVHSFAYLNKTWIFTKPISVVDVVETSKERLANVVMKLKGFPFELASWFVVAFVFNILGGLLGYFAVKEANQTRANRLLMVGFCSFVLLFILGCFGFISLVW